jgi:2-oxoglutarate dehydrogenase complex dehydrogenase (E1) component-like enzyme
MNKSVIISEETHKLLKEYCQIEGIKTQHLADKIIREWLEKKKESK